MAAKRKPRISEAEMEKKYVARERRSHGSDLAFLDQCLPKYGREIINMIGLGVTESTSDPSLKPKISLPAHGFAVTYNRAKKGGGAALHAHLTEEVFIPVRGKWEVFWLEGDDRRSVKLGPGDVIHVPTKIYRGFTLVSSEPDALLIGLIGGPDPGHVDWHPDVLKETRAAGYELDAKGNLRQIAKA
ncbi:MAG: cupin domain-containing protein [Alphaproteobacteria bacterium]|nr:cupin domain-containing protein [Alphaproteobacteria bacterium]